MLQNPSGMGTAAHNFSQRAGSLLRSMLDPYCIFPLLIQLNNSSLLIIFYKNYIKENLEGIAQTD